MARAATKSKANTKTSARSKWKSRAVTRLIEAGSMTECSHCEERVKFRARERHQQVICNVYINGRWDHVEHFHEDCYTTAGMPYGEPTD